MSTEPVSFTKIAGAAALVSGAMVGAGLLALPVRTIGAGFLPSVLALIAMAIYLSATAFLLAEAAINSGAEPGSNILTLAARGAGETGRRVAWVTYCLVYLPVLTAYIAEGGNLVAHGAGYLGLEVLPIWLFQALFAVTFGMIVMSGTASVDVCNRWAMSFACVTFSALVLVAAGGVRTERLTACAWPRVVESIPAIVVALGFHNTIPSVTHYLGDLPSTRIAILAGVAAPLIMYTLWEALILGSIDLESASRTLTFSQILEQLKRQSGESVSVAVEAFSLLAIVTSILGVGLGTVDFVQEGLFGTPVRAPNESHEATTVSVSKQRQLSVLASFGPALAVAVAAPGIFMPALEFSVSASLVLFGILPVILVWNLRYSQGLDRKEEGAGVGTFPGGKAMLVLVVVITALIMLVDWYLRARQIGLL